MAALFVVVVTMLMLAQHRRLDREDPLNTAELQAARRELHQSPGDEAIKSRIRQLDLAVRQQHFEHLRRNRIGAWMLLGGGLVMVGSLARFVVLRKKGLLPIISPKSLHDAEEIEATRGRRAIALTGLLVLGAIGVIGLTQARPPFEKEIAALRGDATDAVPVEQVWLGPSAGEVLANWPRFRGPGGGGVAAGGDFPVQWDADSGENISWKVPVPMGGFSSPVVWGDRLFLTGSDGRAREVFCFDARNGSLLWRVPVKLATDEQVAAMNIPEMTGLAAPTGATDGRHLYAMFGTGEMAAIDFSGRLVWSKNFGRLENTYGHSTSLAIWRNRVLVQIDQGYEDSDRSRIRSLDAMTGEVVWQTRRPVGACWASPIVIDAEGREQFIVPGIPWLMSYDPDDGRELWRAGEFGSDLASSPVFAGGRVFAVSTSEKLMAVRPDGRGDVSDTHVEWVEGGTIPDITSPVSNGELVFLLVSYSGLVCFDVATGDLVWEHELDGEFEASPSIAGDRVYAFSKEGEVFVVEAAREARELGRGRLGEPVHASPAFVGDRIFVRGATNLFCLSVRGSASREVADER